MSFRSNSKFYEPDPPYEEAPEQPYEDVPEYQSTPIENRVAYKISPERQAAQQAARAAKEQAKQEQVEEQSAKPKAKAKRARKEPQPQKVELILLEQKPSSEQIQREITEEFKQRFIILPPSLRIVRPVPSPQVTKNLSK